MVLTHFHSMTMCVDVARACNCRYCLNTVQMKIDKSKLIFNFSAVTLLENNDDMVSAKTTAQLIYISIPVHLPSRHRHEEI